MSPRASAWWCLVLLAACGPSAREDGEAPGLGVQQSPITWNGTEWHPEPWVLAVGDQQVVHSDGYVLAGNYCTSTNIWACSCGAHPACSSGLPGTKALAAFLKKKFPVISSTGGMDSCCRQSAGSLNYLSAHSIGRAIDIMIPRLSSGEANNAEGDPIAAWLIANAQSIGVQYVAWDMAQWAASAPPGRRFGPFSSNISHKDHIHVDLNLAGARKQTRFFTSGAIDGGACTATAGCDGQSVLLADCSRRDCADAGSVCTPEPLGRCVSSQCPPTGLASVCMDDDVLAKCNGGVVLGKTHCADAGAWCSSAGVEETAARCVVSACVDSPQDAPVEHVQCALTQGKTLLCDADGGAREVGCDGGQVCSMLGGSAHCTAPIPECPRPDAGTKTDFTACVDGGAFIRCVNGNVFSVDDCGPEGSCSALGGVAHCANLGCLAAAPATVFCTAEGARQRCDDTGLLVTENECAEGERCVVDGGVPTCAARGGDAGPGAVPPPAAVGATGCGCAGLPGAAWVYGLGMVLFVFARRRA